jgi:DNA-binding response OmpR family regulator
VWTELGNSRLDISGQTLLCGGEYLSLTFRETKLLRLFSENPNQLLEREFIISKVWADEGVLVGRSLDVFVSRLRKKLTGDPSLAIVTVHGVGYKLAINRP